MVHINEFSLLRGSPIQISSACVVRQPTLGEIANRGYDAYKTYLSILMMEKESLFQNLGVPMDESVDGYTVYDIMGAIPDLREVLIEALSFFIYGYVSWNGSHFLIKGTELTAEDLDDVKAAIMKISYIEKDTESQHIFSSEKARKIWEKCQKGKEALRKANKTDENLELPNLVGALAASRNGNYNILNIWDLTVYQLYDQFARTNVGVQMDIYASRWAAWGKDDFDVSMWFKNISKKEG